MEEKDIKQEDLEKGTTEEEETKEETKEEKALTAEDIQKMIQSETDKVRTEYSKRVKELEEQKTALEKEKMTEEEQRQFDLENMQKELEKKENEIKNRELTIKTVDLLKEKELDLDFREFVIGADEESTIERVDKFSSLWTKALENAVNNRFKDSGRDIQKGTGESMTRDQIMGIKDPIKRVEAIRKNKSLFKK